ncbi:hypothetical protein [Sinomicrobium sp. M5D2P17]
MANVPKLLTVLLFIFCFCTLRAQVSEIDFEFGNINPEHLDMLSYEKDTTANALVLYEKGTSKIEKNSFGNVVLSTEIVRRIKILKKDGFNEATLEIPLHKSLESKKRERFIEAEALSVNSDRKVHRLAKKDIFTDHVNEAYDVVKFTVPNVKEGTVIDYRYKTESPFLYNFNSWRFQSDIPKIYSQYSTTIPANYRYNVKLTGFLELDHKESVLKKDCFYFQGVGTADCVNSTYIIKDIPAFKEEDYMVSKYNYLSAIDYELETFQGFDGINKKFTKSWKDVDREIKHREEIGRQARKENYFGKLIPEEISNMPQGMEKAKKIYYHLQDQLFWNGKNYIFNRVDVKDAFEKKSGSTADLNLILLNFLKAAGFKADFMLLSTRNTNLPTKLYPVISEFNYLVIKLDADEKSFLLDLTDKNLPFGTLPFRALNGYGRVMEMDNGSYWYNIIPEQHTQTLISAQISLTGDEYASIKVKESSSFYHALSKRKEMQDTSVEEYKESLQDEYDKKGTYELEEYTMNNRKDLEEQLVERYSFRMEKDPDTQMLILNPFIVGRMDKNPFTLEERTYPVDFGYPFAYVYLIVIDLGEDYEIGELPADRILRLEDGSGKLLFHSSRNGNSVIINARLQFSRSVYAAEEYEGLKKLYTELLSLQNKQPIILERKL